MSNIVRNIQARIESAVIIRARAETRRNLLAMSDRKLNDIGMSRELLEKDLWPWKSTDDDYNDDRRAA